MREIGFEPVFNWPSVFFHKARDLLLMVYVDDFKMSGPAGQMAKTWTEMSSRIQMDDPGAVTKCLGCHHHVRQGVVKGVAVQTIEYDMGDFMLSCAEAYRKAVGEPNMILRAVDTLFFFFLEVEGKKSLPESSSPSRHPY